MSPESNPYAPGAGTPPPELAGRDDILKKARIAIRRNKLGKPMHSAMFVGLRGVGKTVLLNEVEAIAEDEGAITDFIEVSSSQPLSLSIVTSMRKALLKLDRIKGVNEHVRRSLRVLKSFFSTIKVKYNDVELSIDFENEHGVADSGNLGRDLGELFIAAGTAARARKKSIVILIDEIQTLSSLEFEALILALHRTGQKNLPIMLVGAGLPNLIKQSSVAKSYAERLFEYPDIGSLEYNEARQALVAPAKVAEVSFNEDAIDYIIKLTEGYPYFLQEWGYQVWNVAKKSPVTLADVRKASKLALKRLDENFFRSRFVRLTESQKSYLIAMSALGPGPHKTGEIARQSCKSSAKLAMVRDGLIKSGMIYSPKFGYTAFTVPLFDKYMKRVSE